MSELRPCPFCGSDKLQNRPIRNGHTGGTTAIFCCVCGARGGREPNKSVAIIAWNKRVVIKEAKP